MGGDLLIVYEVRLNANPESIVTTSLEEVLEIVKIALMAEPRASPVFIKMRRSRMTRAEYDNLPDAGD